MPETSAGLLLYRRRAAGVEVLLVHPGGPFWAKKDDGAWSIPKGLYESAEDALVAAQREFAEEVGTSPEGPFLPLGEFKLPSGKRLSAWAVEGDLDATAIESNTFEMEWPPKSGRRALFPEVDRAGWFAIDASKVKITKGQLQVIEALVASISG